MEAVNICRTLASPITGTSANISDEEPVRSASDLSSGLCEKLDLVIDGGPCPGAAGSTIVSEKDGELCLLRAGQIPFSQVLEKTG